ncbi:hypothetical protein E2C01_095061 [Portunus trituberculatus]|uniref:Uncharacterized protein n=1 Tax=Portunus trituberculatus TaxID=210409 RepID=A0A5B7K4T0_PORTR|nr:hypothetical protein [Portunus trituberculatus]
MSSLAASDTRAQRFTQPASSRHALQHTPRRCCTTTRHHATHPAPQHHTRTPHSRTSTTN